MANNKKSTRLVPNSFDFLMIILAILLVATTVYRLFGNSELSNFDRDAEYLVEFECESEYNTLQKYIKSGDNVYIMSTGELLGSIYTDNSKGESLPIWEVKDETVTDASSSENSENATEGAINATEKKDTYEMTTFRGILKLDRDAKQSANEAYFTIHDFNVARGSKFEVYTDDAVFTITVLSIKEIEQ